VDTKVEVLEDGQKKLTISVDKKEINDRIKKTYKDFAYKYNFPGFRKGKAPRPVIDSALGKEAVTATVTDDVLNGLYPLALEKHDLIPVGQPTIEHTLDMVAEGKPFTFTAIFKGRPELELSSYEPVHIKLPSEEVTEADVDEQIDELRNYYYDFKDCSAATKVKANGFVELALSAKNDKGEDMPALKADERIYELGKGLFPESFDTELVGMKKGDTKTFDLDLTDDASTMGQAIKGTVTFTVEIKQVKEKVLPTIDDAWAKDKAGFESLADLRTRVSENIKKQKTDMMPRMRENETLYELQERLQGEVPDDLCEAEEQNLLQDFFMQLQNSGMTFDAYLAQYQMTPDKFKEDIKKQAKDVTTQDFALDAWARHLKIEVTPEEVSKEFDDSGIDDPRKVEEEWRVNGRLCMMRAAIRRNKALKLIEKDVVVEEIDPKAEKAAAAKKASDSKPAKKATSKKASTKTKAAAPKKATDK
jgi:trigger factor